MTNLKRFIFLFALTSSSFFYDAHATDFKSNIPYPDFNDGLVLGLLPNKLLFYSGQQNDKFLAGFYKSSDFLGWVNKKFEPLEKYNSAQVKKIESAIQAPDKKTIVLSTVEDVGQLLSNSTDGTNWQTVRITTPTKFDTLVVANNNLQVLAYGKKELLYFTTNNTDNWYQWALPSGCANKQYCVFENQYFNMSNNNYTLIQSTMMNDIVTNKLYKSQDQEYWSTESVPFANSKIIKTFNGKFDTIFVNAVDTDGNNKLWLSVDFDGWVDFDLPKGSLVTDVLVHNKNKIDLLLFYPYSGLPLATDYVTLDTETKTFNTIETFKGKVSHLKLVDEKLYISGKFDTNAEDKHSLLASSPL